MMIKVYHVIYPTYDVNKNIMIGDLHLVAEVNEGTRTGIEAFEYAFEQTNNTQSNIWWKNKSVKFLGSPHHGNHSCRSTSIGDVFQLDTEFFIVDNGFFWPVNVEMLHVDDYLNSPNPDPIAKEFLEHARLPDINKNTSWLHANAPTVTWRGKRYRCVGASRLGDVWLKGDELKQSFYDHRVNVAELSDWQQPKR